jgi:predicted kinase
MATLHIFCGKIASGKSSLAARLAAGPGTVLLSEDQLLSRLYPGEILTLEDYVRSARRLREAVAPLVQDLLRQGLDVVLDFQANTPAGRHWFRSLFESAGASHQLHWLRAADATCKARLTARNAEGRHEYQVSDAEFELFNSHIVPPTPEEGFVIIRHEQDG